METLGRAKNLQRLSVAIWGWRYQDIIPQLGAVLANKALFVELKQVLFKWRSERWGDLSHYLDQLNKKWATSTVATVLVGTLRTQLVLPP